MILTSILDLQCIKRTVAKLALCVSGGLTISIQDNLFDWLGSLLCKHSCSLSQVTGFSISTRNLSEISENYCLGVPATVFT